MKIPVMLQDYLDETEQESENMSDAELFEEALWVYSQYKVGEYHNETYTRQNVTALKAFITRISSKLFNNLI